jgi:phosphatidate cytidylyltransferase
MAHSTLQSVLQATLAGFVLGIIFMCLANRRVTVDVARQRWLKLVVYFVIFYTVIGACLLGQMAITALAVLIVIVSTVELESACRKITKPCAPVIWPLYLSGCAGFMISAAHLPSAQIAYVFIVVAAFDGFSQVAGQWLGKHQLAPSVSPNKTIEGLAGGLSAAVLFAVVLRQTLPASMGSALLLGALIGVASLAGDLTSSWVKRRAGIKDYAATLPGQGGFLDRFNSFISSGAIVGALLQVRTNWL